MTWKPSAHAERIRELASSHTSNQIAKLTGLTGSGVRDYCRRHGIEIVAERGFWTDDMDDAIRSGAAARDSLSTVANLLGVSRSAIAGRARRLKVQFHGKQPKEVQVQNGKRTAQVLKARAAAKSPKPTTARAPAAVKVGSNGARVYPQLPVKPLRIVNEPPPAGAKTLLELRNRDCRWPFGEPTSDDFRFCGAPKCATHDSYCAEHALLSKSGIILGRPRAA